MEVDEDFTVTGRVIIIFKGDNHGQKWHNHDYVIYLASASASRGLVTISTSCSTSAAVIDQRSRQHLIGVNITFIIVEFYHIKLMY